MLRIRIRPLALLTVALASTGIIACRGESARSAAADVPADDVRRLPPTRKAHAPDAMLSKSDRGRTLGADSAPVRMYVVSDFQCADCRTWFDSILPVIRDAYVAPGRVRLVWVNYPLREHPAAVRAASAALCAGVTGHFWEVGRRLFASAERWGTTPVDSARIDSIASVPGIDPYTLRLCTTSNRMLRQVRGDIVFTDSLGAGAPPSVIIGRRVLPRGTTLASLRAILDSTIDTR